MKNSNPIQNAEQTQQTIVPNFYISDVELLALKKASKLYMTDTENCQPNRLIMGLLRLLLTNPECLDPTFDSIWEYAEAEGLEPRDVVFARILTASKK